jgi:uncharacterized protein (TIGR03437 family)
MRSNGGGRIKSGLARLGRRGVGLSIVWSGLAICGMASGLSGVASWQGGGSALTTVSAASYEPGPVAPGSIVATFGADLASQTVAATDLDPATPGIQLPTQLGGTTVEVAGQLAELLFVSPGQINWVLPTGLMSGTAPVVVRSGTGQTANGSVELTPIAPAIFAANATGTGPAAAEIVRLTAGGALTYEPAIEYSPALSRFVPIPIDLGPEGERLFLVLYLTGIRGWSESAGDSLRILMGGLEVVPTYVGPQLQYVGLDQINVEIPRSLLGRGVVTVALAGGGVLPSNLVEIQIAGPVGASPPTISSLGSAAALAGTPWRIDGSGFSPVPEENEVLISSLLADVVEAATTQLRVVVPFGVASGAVTVRTPLGEGLSSTFLPIRTSISGVVEDTLRQPIPGVPIRLADGMITATTNEEGTFVLADVPPGIQTVEVEAETLSASPPYPSITLKVSALPDRDNQVPRAISIQQATGASGTIGTADEGGATPPSNGEGEPLPLAQQVDPPPVQIETDGFLLEVPAKSRVRFPGGATSGPVFVTPVEGSRAPVNLPLGFFSSSIVQITPFGVTIDPGARLVFPNSAKLPAGSEARLFRYDPQSGRFLPESIQAQVSIDGRSIETPPGAIRVTSLYFVAVAQPTTTVAGRVLEGQTKAPVRNALVSLRGQEGRTDGNGSYLLRAVPVEDKEEISVEVRVQRPAGRIDRLTSSSAPAIVGGLTRLPDLLLPNRTENRPPVILGPAQAQLFAGRETLIRYSIYDPDQDEIEMVSSEGPTWATIAPAEKGAIGTYDLRLAPTAKDVGRFIVILTANDRRGAKQSIEVRLEVREAPGPPPAPTALDLTVTTPEDTEVEISLLPKEPPSVPQAYQIVTGPFNGKLEGADGRYRYLPNRDYVGTDRLTYRVEANGQQSRLGTVTITITPVNDPPVLVLPLDQTVTAGRLLRLPISATDPDADQTLTLVPILPLPEGATFQRTRPDAGSLVWTPTPNQLGVFTIRFRVTDSHDPPTTTEGSLRLTVVR